MRWLVLAVRNLIVLVWTLLTAPLRLLQRRGRPTYVRFRLAGDPPYRPTARAWLSRFRRPEPDTITSLSGFADQVRLLARSSDVKGVLLVVEGFEGGPAKRDAVRKLLAELRVAGKEVVGYAVVAENLEYEVLCAANRIALPPAGRLELKGFAAEATAAGAGLQRLGVTAHFVRRGEHKTAPEVFTRNQVSEIQRKTLETILEEHHRELVSQVAEGRRVGAEQARRWIDEGPYSARRALSLGLCDALVSEADLPRYLAGLPVPAPESEEKSEAASRVPRLGSFGAYASTLVIPPDRFRRRKVPLAVVPLAGIIGHGKVSSPPFGPRMVASDAAVKALRAAERHPAPAIVLFIDSPGGSAIGSEIILEQIQRTARKKPVVAYVDRVAASGGYMAALGAKEIWAAPRAILGSIGVFAGKFDVSGLIQRLGVDRQVLTRGEHAAIYSPSRGFTPGELAALETDVEETYQAFLEHVARARGKSRAEVHQHGEGRIFSGTAGVEVGLIDRTGSLDDACRRALELAGRSSDGFDLSVLGFAPRPLGLVRLFQMATQPTLWALWDPWLSLPGVPLRNLGP